jgi:O-antigen ligase
VWAYVIALLVVIIYTTKIHSGYGFSEKAGHWVMSPFYNDHTAYGAILAMFVPVVAGFIVDIKSKPFMRIVSLAALLMLLLALYLSYSRAAWVSVGFAVGVLVLVKLKIKFKWIATGTIVLVALFFSFKFEILDRLEKNKQDASANFIEHVQSISNISSDASNLERINRWQAALRMYSEKPFFGWGPGTYQFEYAPFQRSKEKTIISTNLGDMGNSHSEYIGPLAESGWPGLLTVLIMFITIIYSGLKVYSQSENSRSRILSLSVTLGLITYLVHGLLNNFLNTDKASVPFWGFVAIIVAIDLYEIRVKNTDNRPLEE